MPFSQEKLDEIRTGVAEALASEGLTDWERGFLTDMRARLDRHGRATTLSTKQYRLLMRLSQAGGGKRTTPAKASTGQPGKRPAARRQSKSANRAQAQQHRRPARSRGNLRQTKRVVGALIAVVVLVFLAQTDGSVGTGGVDTARAALGTVVSKPSAPGTASLIGLTSRDVRVVDGDTIRVPGDSRRIRLVGFNTPEVFSPRCERERQLGMRATVRLKEMLNQAERIEFQRVACACKPGTEGTKACNFGRLCGHLKVDGHDVGEVLIAEGLAARYRCGRYSCPPAPGNWCR